MLADLSPLGEVMRSGAGLDPGQAFVDARR